MNTLHPTTINAARTQANIAERAAHLFTPGHKDGGYRAKPFDTNPAMFFVIPPAPTKPVYIVDTLRRTCSCPAHSKWRTCKHRQGIELMIEDDRRADEAEDFADYGRYDFGDNAEQMDDRPTVAAGYDCLGRLQPA